MGDLENKTPWIIAGLVIGGLIIIGVSPIGDWVMKFITDTFNSMGGKVGI